jgi:uncharacterized protein (TIGR03435 family)
MACVLAPLLAVSVVTARAQTIQTVDDAKLPRFDVVSVKPSDPNANRGSFGFPLGGFHQENVTLFNTLLTAFAIRPYQVPAMPDMIQRERYTIDARAPAGASRTDLPLMVRALLIDRFKLRYHIDRKEEDAYVLTLARRDGRLGPHMRSSSVDCAARRAAAAQQQPVDPLPPGAAECGVRNGPGMINFGGMPFASFVQMLSNQVGKQVVDQTGLSGNYDVDLRFALASAGAPRTDGQAATPDDAPSIFTAVQEQLGLKLTPGKAPVDVLVIDHIEQPDPD